eukprot:Amastigsp_a509384_154.p3 type:complete len:189 gc:universal Amastigsp_a509384_154:583-1149(+)
MCSTTLPRGRCDSSTGALASSTSRGARSRSGPERGTTKRPSCFSATPTTTTQSTCGPTAASSRRLFLRGCRCSRARRTRSRSSLRSRAASEPLICTATSANSGSPSARGTDRASRSASASPGSDTSIQSMQTCARPRPSISSTSCWSGTTRRGGPPRRPSSTLILTPFERATPQSLRARPGPCPAAAP